MKLFNTFPEYFMAIYLFYKYRDLDSLNQGTNARKINCGRVCSAYIWKPVHILWADFVNKNRCISVRLVSEEVKNI